MKPQQQTFHGSPLKSIRLFCTLNELSTCGFVTSYIIRKYWFTELCKSSKYNKFHDKISDITFIDITTYFIFKILGTITVTHFQKLYFSLESSIFIIGNKYYQLFSSTWQTMFIFRKICATYLSLNSHSLPGILWSKNDVLWKKQLILLAAQTTTQMLPLESTTIFWYATEVLYL